MVKVKLLIINTLTLQIYNGSLFSTKSQHFLAQLLIFIK